MEASGEGASGLLGRASGRGEAGGAEGAAGVVPQIGAGGGRVDAVGIGGQDEYRR